MTWNTWTRRGAAVAISLAGFAGGLASADTGMAANGSAAPTDKNPPASPSGGVAVVEAFVSQGCDYCPPVEKLLADVVRQAHGQDKPVYLLAFHVDYFDSHAWKDPFDAAAYTDRQRAHSDAMHTGSIGTPQTIVNGQVQFAGADRSRTDKAVADALAAPQATPVTVTVSGNATDGYQVAASVKSATAGSVVNVAVVEQGLSSSIRGGENAGLHIDEPYVVRWFKTVDASGAVKVTIPPLPDVHVDRASVVAFVESKPAGPVTGATAAELR